MTKPVSLGWLASLRERAAYSARMHLAYARTMRLTGQLITRAQRANYHGSLNTAAFMRRTARARGAYRAP